MSRSSCRSAFAAPEPPVARRPARTSDAPKLALGGLARRAWPDTARVKRRGVASCDPCGDLIPPAPSPALVAELVDALP